MCLCLVSKREVLFQMQSYVFLNLFSALIDYPLGTFDKELLAISCEM